MPDNYRIAPHFHPADEHVTVISGTLNMDLGEKFDLKTAKPMTAGSFMVMPKGVSHFAWTRGAKEIHKLVRASEAFHRDQSNNPFPSGDTERVYWELLSRMHKGEIGPKDRPRTRVVVDIISGTSAGGINGICLAKALAHNLSQDALKQLWIEKGDIGLLWRGPSLGFRGALALLRLH